MGHCAGWSAGWWRAERSASMRRNDPRRPAGCLTVFTEPLNGDVGGQLRRGKNGGGGVVEIVPVSFLKRGWMVSWIVSWVLLRHYIRTPLRTKTAAKMAFFERLTPLYCQNTSIKTPYCGLFK